MILAAVALENIVGVEAGIPGDARCASAVIGFARNKRGYSGAMVNRIGLAAGATEHTQGAVHTEINHRHPAGFIAAPGYLPGF